jgi:hypothetical protein
MVGLLQRNTRDDNRAAGFLTDMHFTEYTEFTRKPIFSQENGRRWETMNM